MSAAAVQWLIVSLHTHTVSEYQPLCLVSLSYCDSRQLLTAPRRRLLLLTQCRRRSLVRWRRRWLVRCSLRLFLATLISGSLSLIHEWVLQPIPVTWLAILPLKVTRKSGITTWDCLFHQSSRDTLCTCLLNFIRIRQSAADSTNFPGAFFWSDFVACSSQSWVDELYQVWDDKYTERQLLAGYAYDI